MHTNDQKQADPDRLGDDDLFCLVQAELRQWAHRRMVREPSDHTLQTTALVNEAWLRLAEQQQLRPADRQRVVRLASREMRRILVDRARRRRANPVHRIDDDTAFTEPFDEHGEPRPELSDLDAALTALAAHDERASEVVELVCFGGREQVEVAEILEVSTRTVQRDWDYACAFLRRELSRGADAHG